MNEDNLARRIDSSGERVAARASSVPARPALRIVQGTAPVVRLRRRKPFRLEFPDSGYRPFRVR
jgi:hypothetical protein